MTERRDVQASLAEMDRKLRELQRELAMVSRPTQTPPPPPEPPAAAETAAQAIVAEARAEAARIVDEAAARVAEIGEQIDELQRLREDLQRSARALVDEYERALWPGTAAAAPSSGPAPPEHAAPASGTAVPPPAEARQFEGRVVVNAGPFTDIATLAAFERALAQLPQAEDVYVHGFEGNRALIDVKLAAPVALLDEMRRALPIGFGVVEVGHGRITIDINPH
jgi:hypothetical protein